VALQGYHREQLSNNAKIAAHLLADHGIRMSAVTVKRRRKALGLTRSGVTTRTMPHQEAEQLVMAQLDKDPAKRHGVRTIQHKIVFNKGVHLTRDFVLEVMHVHDPEGFERRELTAKRISGCQRFPLEYTSVGQGMGTTSFTGLGLFF